MQSIVRKSLAAVLLLALAACATVDGPVDPAYTGPRVRVDDYHVPMGGTRARFFVVEEVDGQPINNALIETRRASAGRGFSMSSRGASRQLPARPLKLKLLATEEAAAPIETLFRATTGSRPLTVEGDVDFVPQQGHDYEIKGEMSSDESSVWVHDVTADSPATPKVTSRRK